MKKGRQSDPKPLVMLDVTVVTHYITTMIRSFADKQTAIVFQGRFSKRLPQEIQMRALDKLRMIEAATELVDLLIPPSNNLEALKGNRLGQHSIRINRQYRICFKWVDGDAHDVEITDYH